MNDPTRRMLLLLPLALSACGDDEAASKTTYFEPLRFDYLPPIQMNVAAIDIQQRFIPAGVAPDVSLRSPAPPIEALRRMATDRLQAFGTANKAVFAILDASLTQANDVLRGNFAVSLTVYDTAGMQQGYAEAHVQQSHAGRISDLRRALYDMTKAMLDDMNVELEFQIRRNLRDWLTVAVAPDLPVQRDPLEPAR